MQKNILLTIAYDGSGFHGWQKQPGSPTVQGYLERVLSRLFDREILLHGTSRTDAGVHALGQRASFKADINIPTDRLARVMNNALAGCEKGSFATSPVRIVEAEEMPPDFHARFDAKGKEYIYRVFNSERTPLFQRRYLYHVAEPLDADAMRGAAAYIEGTHDFKSFEASGGTPRESTVRSIWSLRIDEKESYSFGLIPGNPAENAAAAGDAHAGEKLLELHVKGDGFLYNMVRIIAGTLVDVGRGAIAPEEIPDIIEATDRGRAGHTAPPGGLYLAEVYY